MARSASLAAEGAPETLGEDFAYLTSATGRDPGVFHYSALLQDHQLIHREQVFSPGREEPVYRLDVRQDYAIGSGNRGKSYLSNYDGVVLMSPMTWYSRINGWELSPGYENGNLHFQRRIVDGCVQCHISRAEPDPVSVNRFRKEPFPELAIGCERCHGPGEALIRFHRELPSSVAGQKDPVVNPAKLAPDRRDDVCLQCHLIGEFRLPRYRRSDFDFHAGDRLTDVWTTFLRRNAGVDGQQQTEAASQPEQMLSSVCYVKSRRKLGCISCHDAHHAQEPQTHDVWFNGRCLECHTSSTTECSEDRTLRQSGAWNNSCIDCHMPSIAANDIPHTSQTDHRILRRPPDARTRRPVVSSELQIYGEKTGVIPASELSRARAIQLVQAAETAGRQRAVIDAIPVLQQWIAVARDDVPALEALGIASLMMGDEAQAEAAWQQGLQQHPEDERFLRRLMILYQDSRRPAEALQMAQRLILVNDKDHEVHGRMAQLYEQTGQLNEGIAAAERAIELNPAAIAVYQWLGKACEIAAQPDKARLYQDLANSLSNSQSPPP